MVWIGSKQFSKEAYNDSGWKLYRNNTNFELLGKTISINLDDMINSNYNAKVEELKKELIKQWKLGKITILGRLTVINHQIWII